MNKIELYEYRNKDLVIKVSGGTSMAYKWMVFYYDGKESAYIEWIDDEYYREHRRKYEGFDLRRLKQAIQGDYRQILDKKYIDNIIRTTGATEAKEAILDSLPREEDDYYN